MGENTGKGHQGTCLRTHRQIQGGRIKGGSWGWLGWEGVLGESAENFT